MEKLQPEQIETVLGHYPLGSVRSFERLSSGYSNDNYKVDTDQGSYLYRICKRQSLDSILYEMKLMQALKKIEFPAAFPIPRNDGNYVTPLGCDTADATQCERITIYEFIQGEEPEVNPEAAKAVAMAIGELNQLKDWKKFPRKNPINLDNCYQLIQQFKDSKYKYTDIFEYFIEQTEYLEKHLSRPVPKGIIHGDIFPDNTVFSGNNLLAIIDFEYACSDNLLIDLGVAINGFCCPQNCLDEHLLITFIQSYNQIRRLTPEEIELLPYYIQWGGHGMLSWHLKNDLLNRESERKLTRAKEHMERVKSLRSNETKLTQTIQEIASCC